MFQTNVVEKLLSHILNSITFSENRTIYEIMGKCFRARQPRMTNMAHAHFTLEPKATNTHTGFAIRISFSLQQWLHERALILRSTCIACLVDLIDEDTKMLRNVVSTRSVPSDTA